MNALAWLISAISQFLSGRSARHSIPSNDTNGADKANIKHNLRQKRNFDEDYRAATSILKSRMDQKFPDNYDARKGQSATSQYDHGEDRAAAIDTMSSAIAASLRKGASVHQAAAAGAASVGI